LAGPFLSQVIRNQSASFSDPAILAAVHLVGDS
jgi:hypothetical protein